MSTKIFDLRALDMSSAYDWSQSEPIKHGDVMLVADGVAIMCEAWPVMVAGASDVFHRVADGVTWERFAHDCPRPGMADRLLAGVAVARRPVADLVAEALTYSELAAMAEGAALADLAAPSCPHCGRDLETVAELAAALCTSDDCPRHDPAADRLAATRCAA
jgi:hypothetical protein